MKWYSSLLLIILVVLLACAKKHEKETSVVLPPDKIAVLKPLIAEPEPEINYSFLALDTSNRKKLGKIYNDTQLNIILAINRIDFSKLYREDTLVIPDTFLTGFKYYSPFPDSLHLIKDVRKILLFAYKIQAFAVYECGALVRWGPNSMGKQSTPTPTGLFHTNWRAEKTVSTDDSTWIMYWYFNLHNERGVSMHQYELPGYPASHACIRLLESDAKWLYNWADQWKLTADRMRVRAYGTPVIIFGQYDFEGNKPWYQLPHNAKALHISADSLNKEIIPFLPTILQRQQVRDSITMRRIKDKAGNEIAQ